MSKTFTITLSDELERALASQSERLNKSQEEVMLQLLSQNLENLDTLFQSERLKQVETDPLLRLIGAFSVDVNDLAENHDRHIGREFDLTSDRLANLI